MTLDRQRQEFVLQHLPCRELVRGDVAVPEPELRAFLAACGARLLRAESRNGGAVQTVRFDVAPAGG